MWGLPGGVERGGVGHGPRLGPVVPFLTRFFFGWEGEPPTKIDYRRKVGTLKLTSLEDLVGDLWTSKEGCFDDPPPPNAVLDMSKGGYPKMFDPFSHSKGNQQATLAMLGYQILLCRNTQGLGATGYVQQLLEPHIHHYASNTCFLSPLLWMDTILNGLGWMKLYKYWINHLL